VYPPPAAFGLGDRTTAVDALASGQVQYANVVTVVGCGDAPNRVPMNSQRCSWKDPKSFGITNPWFGAGDTPLSVKPPAPGERPFGQAAFAEIKVAPALAGGACADRTDGGRRTFAQ
jgi:hypothetical protein